MKFVTFSISNSALRPSVFDLEMRAQRSRGNFKDLYGSSGDLLARASENMMHLPGDVIGSGTVGTACLLKLTKAQGPWLNEGDMVKLEIERLGILRN